MSGNVRLVIQLCQKLINCGRNVSLVTNHRCHRTDMGAKKLPSSWHFGFVDMFIKNVWSNLLIWHFHNRQKSDKNIFCTYGTTLHMWTHLCGEYNSWFRKWSFPFSRLVKNPYATTLLRFGVVLWMSLERKRSMNEVIFILATQISNNLYFATFFSEHMIKK